MIGDCNQGLHFTSLFAPKVNPVVHEMTRKRTPKETTYTQAGSRWLALGILALALIPLHAIACNMIHGHILNAFRFRPIPPSARGY